MKNEGIGRLWRTQRTEEKCVSVDAHFGDIIFPTVLPICLDTNAVRLLWLTSQLTVGVLIKMDLFLAVYVVQLIIYLREIQLTVVCI